MKGRCPECKGIIHSNPFINHDFQRCACGKTAIDDAGYYCRFIGNTPLVKGFVTFNKKEAKDFQRTHI